MMYLILFCLTAIVIMAILVYKIDKVLDRLDKFLGEE